ncbi:hypothetical protein F8388_014171, partial [Cannabis sativa]
MIALMSSFSAKDFGLSSVRMRSNNEQFQGILHTILFHRALGLVRPKDADLELFDITYVNLEIEKKIEEKIKQFISWVEKHPNEKSQIYDFDRDYKDVGVALFTTKYFFCLKLLAQCKVRYAFINMESSTRVGK